MDVAKRKAFVEGLNQHLKEKGYDVVFSPYRVELLNLPRDLVTYSSTTQMGLFFRNIELYDEVEAYAKACDMPMFIHEIETTDDGDAIHYFALLTAKNEKFRTCADCMFQRYQRTDKGQAWVCRREGSDQKLHYEDASRCVCTFDRIE